MPSNGDQMYTFQLDSEAAERVNDGHYKVVLNPQLELPLLAEGREDRATRRPSFKKKAQATG